MATRESVTPVYPATPAALGLYDPLGGGLEIADELAYESVAAASATVAAYFRYLGTIADWLSAAASRPPWRAATSPTPLPRSPAS